MGDADIASYKEAFSLFDKRGNGRVTRESIGDLLRAIGQNPTLAEISGIEEQIGADISFDSFLEIVNRPDGFRPPGDPEDFIRGFQVFDKDNSGYIGLGELRYVLTSLGEKLSDEEVDELLKGISTKEGTINYSGTLDMVLSHSY